MEQLLLIREQIIKLYRKYETPLNYAVRFLLGLLVFSMLNLYFDRVANDTSTPTTAQVKTTTANGTTAKATATTAKATTTAAKTTTTAKSTTTAKKQLSGMDMVSKQVSSPPVAILFSFLSAIVPLAWVYVLLWLFITAHLVFVSIETALIGTVLLFCFLLLYTRIFPKESLLIIALCVAFYLKVPYAVPIVAGLYFGVPAVGAMIIGNFVWFASRNLHALRIAGLTANKDPDLANLTKIALTGVQDIIDNVLLNPIWIYLALVFSATIIIVYIFARLPLNHSYSIAIALGITVVLVGMVVGIATEKIPYAMGGTILSIVGSSLLAFIAKFFYIALDYQRTQRVSFEDESNMYYVKVVPKLTSNPEDIKLTEIETFPVFTKNTSSSSDSRTKKQTVSTKNMTNNKK